MLRREKNHKRHKRNAFYVIAGLSGVTTAVTACASIPTVIGPLYAVTFGLSSIVTTLHLMEMDMMKKGSMFSTDEKNLDHLFRTVLILDNPKFSAEEKEKAFKYLKNTIFKQAKQDNDLNKSDLASLKTSLDNLKMTGALIEALKTQIVLTMDVSDSPYLAWLKMKRVLTSSKEENSILEDTKKLICIDSKGEDAN